MSIRTAVVEVPATSANLGPGFDSLGVALEWTARLHVSIVDEPVDEPASPIERMTVGAVSALYRQAGVELPAGITAKYEGDIPIGRGLGISAAARAAGLLAGDALIDGGHDVEDLIPLAVKLEGHGDNIVPALLGGLQVVVEDDGEIVHVGVEPPSELRLALVTPQFSMPTNESRKRLPEQLTRNQAVHNIGRAAMLIAALGQRRYDLLAVATEDVLHQPTRSTLFPAMYPIFEAARKAGAHGVYLSGGGSTIAAFATEGAEAIAGAMREAAAAHGLDAEARVCAMRSAGASVVSTE